MIVLLLAALYLSDCLWIARWNSIAVERTWPSRRWRLRTPSDWASTARRSLVALLPLPGSAAGQLDAPPISLSPRGLAAWTPFAWSDKGRPEQSGGALAWSEIGEITTNDADLLVDGQVFQRFSCRSEATLWAELTASVRDAAPPEREQILEDFIASRMDPAAVRERLESVWRATRSLRWTGTVQWLVMFILAPAVLSRFGGPLILLILAASIFALAAVNAVLFARAHRRISPEDRWKRAESTILMLLSWPMAARASDLATRHSLARFDPIAAVLAVHDADQTRRFFQRVLRDARHPLEVEPLDPLARDTAEWFVSLWLGSVVRSAERLGVAVSDPAGSAANGGTTGSFCPRCLSTYESGASTCSDCPGVRLERADRTKGD